MIIFSFCTDYKMEYYKKHFFILGRQAGCAVLLPALMLITF